jgi:hypothetical protein
MKPPRKRRESKIYLYPAKKGKPRPIRLKGRTAVRKVRRARNPIRVEISLWFKIKEVRKEETTGWTIDASCLLGQTIVLLH